MKLKRINIRWLEAGDRFYTHEGGNLCKVITPYGASEDAYEDWYGAYKDTVTGRYVTYEVPKLVLVVSH